MLPSRQRTWRVVLSIEFAGRCEEYVKPKSCRLTSLRNGIVRKSYVCAGGYMKIPLLITTKEQYVPGRATVAHLYREGQVR
jgi:hypothetical protein